MEDALGNQLQEGDVVMVPCRVTKLHLHDHYWNLSVRTLVANRPSDDGHVLHTCCDRVIRANPGDAGGAPRANLELGTTRSAG